MFSVLPVVNLISSQMSHREEMHLKILKAFVGLHEFSDLNLVQALRFVQFRLIVKTVLSIFRFSARAAKVSPFSPAFNKFVLKIFLWQTVSVELSSSR